MPTALMDVEHRGQSAASQPHARPFFSSLRSAFAHAKRVRMLEILPEFVAAARDVRRHDEWGVM